jgi:hypothetical protein
MSADEAREIVNARLGEPEEAGGEGRPSAGERMMRLLEQDYAPGISPEGDVFAIERDGPRVALLLVRYGSLLRAAALTKFRAKYGETPSANAARGALAMFEADTRFAGLEPTPLHMRFAHPSPERLLIDLGDAQAHVVDVLPDGWEVRLPTADDPLFVRTPRLGAYPVPLRGGSLVELRKLVNLSDEEWDVYIAWLISAMFPSHPHPVLFVEAPHGTGKTTIGNIALAHLDPGNWMGAKPRDDRSWETRLSRSYAVGIDNVSRLLADVQDAVARAITGDEISRRRLFTDDDEIRFVLLARMVMTSIGLPDKRGDFADRLLLLQPREWPAGSALLEEDVLRERILELVPVTFGALLDLASDVLGILPAARSSPPPGLRMAAFGVFLKAFDLACGTDTVETYRQARIDVTQSALEGDPLWPHLVDLVADYGGSLELSASEIQAALLRRLRDVDEHKDLVRRAEGRTGELRSPTATGSWLSRLAGSARPLGWTFAKKHSGDRIWVISPPAGKDDGNLVSDVSDVSGEDASDTPDSLLQPSSPALGDELEQLVMRHVP